MLSGRKNQHFCDKYRRLYYGTRHPGIERLPVRETLHATLTKPVDHNVSEQLKEVTEQQKNYSRKTTVKMINKVLQKGLTGQSSKDDSNSEDDASDSDS